MYRLALPIARRPPTQGTYGDEQPMCAEVPQSLSIQGIRHSGDGFTPVV
jgi:hypothetical protein